MSHVCRTEITNSELDLVCDCGTKVQITGLRLYVEHVGSEYQEITIYGETETVTHKCYEDQKE